jgi:UDP-glucose 4-epimerase
MRVAVTGGAGYIGSVVSEVLIREGHHVLVLDNLVKGHREAIVEGAHFASVDIADRTTCASELRDFRCEAVIHMAAYSLVGESVAEPAKYYRNNVVAGLSLLEAMRDANVPRMVFSSTAAVYGEPVKQPIEESDPTVPTNPYGETKISFERTLRWYADAYGLSSVSLRYFNAAGATERCGEQHDPETHLIPLVLAVARGTLPSITVFGTDYPTPDGTCIRDYIHVGDLAAAHVAALDWLTCHPQENLVANCGYGTGLSVLQVLDAVDRVSGAAVKRVIERRRAGDPPALVASNAHLLETLDWSPSYADIDRIAADALAWEKRLLATA